MRKRRVLFMMVGMISILAMAGAAFAANEVFLKTTVPNMPQTPCEQAGTISQEYAPGSVLSENDVIEFTLSNNVSICKQIDFFLRLTSTEHPADANGLGGYQLPSVNNADFPVVVTNISEDAISIFDITLDHTYPAQAAGDFALYGDLYELGFLVRGNVGAQRMYLTLSRRALRDGFDPEYPVAADASGFNVYEGMVYNVPADDERLGVYFGWLAATGDAADRMTIRLFDEKYSGLYYGTYGTQGQAMYFFKEDDYTTTSLTYKDYVDDTEPEDNVLCVNVMNFTQEYVEATPDDMPTDPQFAITFSGDYTIARVLADVNYVLEAICKPNCYDVAIGEEVGQFGTTGGTTAFDPGEYSSALDERFSPGVGMCNGAGGIGFLVYNDMDTLPNDELILTLTVLVNGLEAETTAYWAGAAPDAMYWADNDEACYSTSLQQIGYTRAFDWVRDSTNTAIDHQIQGRFKLGTGSDQVNGFVIDLGTIGIDPSRLDDGDEISVNVRLEKFPCSVLIDEELCVANMVDECTAGGGGTGGATTLTFPYVTGLEEPWFCGIAIDNMGTVAGPATITMYDAEGGMGVFETPDIPAGGQWRAVTTAMIGSITGDLNLGIGMWMTVETEYPADGIMFLTGPNGDVMHGYLPRK